MRNRVRLARVEKDYTQKQLAEKIGITRQTVSLIEKGEYNPSLKLCLNICYALNRKLDDLFWIDEGEKRDEKGS